MEMGADAIEQQTSSAGGKIRLPPIGFWSYARQDDELSQGKLSALRSLLMFELQQQYGREQIHIFQDVSTIPHGAAWEEEIRGALGKTTFFIAIITPNFIQSDWCSREVEVFLEREEELYRLYPDLPRRSRLFPILFIDIADVEPADAGVLESLRKLQWFDFRKFRHRSYDSDTVREALSELAGSLREVLQIKVEDPEAARQRALLAEAAAARARREEEAKAVRARQEAEAKAAQAREAEAKRRRTEAAAKAEAARKRAEEAADAARRLADEAAAAARLQAEEAAAAAQLLVEEEAAAEQARVEAEAARARLSGTDVQEAERIEAEREESLRRARLESELADRARIEKEAVAEAARRQSEALAAEESQLAEAAEAAETDAMPSFWARRPPWMKSAAAVAAASAILLLFFYLLTGPPMDRTVTPQQVPDKSVPAPAKAGTAASAPLQAPSWLLGRWGLEGDCSTITTITAEGNRIVVNFEGQRITAGIREAAADIVETEHATYLRSAQGVDVRENAATGSIPYSMRRCG
jgi:hypothetical protein